MNSWSYAARQACCVEPLSCCPAGAAVPLASHWHLILPCLCPAHPRGCPSQATAAQRQLWTRLLASTSSGSYTRKAPAASAATTTTTASAPPGLPRSSAPIRRPTQSGAASGISSGTNTGGSGPGALAGPDESDDDSGPDDVEGDLMDALEQIRDAGAGGPDSQWQQVRGRRHGLA